MIAWYWIWIAFTVGGICGLFVMILITFSRETMIEPRVKVDPKSLHTVWESTHPLY